MEMDRLAALFGPEASELADDLDLTDEGERIELVEQLTPRSNHSVPGGPSYDEVVSMRTIVVNQILDDDPPEAWQTFNRLLDVGLSPAEAIGQLAAVNAQIVADAMQTQQRPEPSRYLEALDNLPMPTPQEVGRELLSVARSEPGIAAEDHERAVIESFPVEHQAMVEDMVDRVLESLIEGPLVWLARDRTGVVPDLVDGAVFTHRLSDVEIELDTLTVGFDLGPLNRFMQVKLDDGTELEPFSVEHGHMAWHGPDGWLTRFAPDDLLAIVASVDASEDPFEPMSTVITITVVDEPTTNDELVTIVAEAYDTAVAEPGLPVSGADIGWWALLHHPGCFATPQSPLSKLAEASGLELRGSYVAHDESIWRNDVFRARFHEAMNIVADTDTRMTIGRALEALDNPDASVDDVRGSLDACATPDALHALGDVLFDHYLEPSDEFELRRAGSPGSVFELVDRAVSVARRPAEVATAQYLAAVLAERSGQPDKAEQHLKRANDAKARIGPVVERLGWYRFDRGDARGAMQWWRALNRLPEAASVIEPFLAPAPKANKLGRNDPCWCGSGRKFKQCHQGEPERAALPDRVGWLCRKAATWIDHCVGEPRALVMTLATSYATGDPDVEWWEVADDDIVAEDVEAAFDDPIVFDLALHEGGLFHLFLRDRGALLPEDEQLLAATWATIDRSVHEVIEVDPGVGMTVRDVATGEVLGVRERTASTQIEVGERMCARVVPDGASHQFIGGIFPVGTGQENTVLELCQAHDPLALAAWAGAIYQPPRIDHVPGMAADMFDQEALTAALTDIDPDADPAEAMAALQAELRRQAQQRWVDESVPALGGATPREAAQDPTRRDQLIQLLAEFDRQDRFGDLPEGMNPMSMDTNAIRNELGLV